MGTTTAVAMVVLHAVDGTRSRVVTTYVGDDPVYTNNAVCVGGAPQDVYLNTDFTCGLNGRYVSAQNSDPDRPILALMAFGILKELYCDCTENLFASDIALSPTTYPPLTTTAGDATAATVTLTEETDLVSLTCGDKAGLTHCGARAVSFTDNATGDVIDMATHPFLSYDDASRVLSAQTSSLNDVGTLVVDVEYSLVEYPAVTHTAQVTVDVINPCLTTTLDTFAPFSLTVSELGLAS